MSTIDNVDIRSELFARRLGDLLTTCRRHSGRSRRALARASEGEFSAKHLRTIESGRTVLTESIAGSAALLYGADLGEILPSRQTLVIDPSGEVSTSGTSVPFDPSDEMSLLTSYLKLIHDLRGGDGPTVMVLRSSDIEVIAGFLGKQGTVVLDQLGELMGTGARQRREMAGMLESGASVVTMAGSAAASLIDDR